MSVCYLLDALFLRRVALLGILGLAMGIGGGQANAQVLVIAHASVPADTITQTELLDLYTGEVRFWHNGQHVIIYDLQSQGETRDSFYTFLGKTSSRIKSIWLRRKLSGEGDPPERLASEEELLVRVQSTPGAIGFVALAGVPPDVKVLTRISPNLAQ